MNRPCTKWLDRDSGSSTRSSSWDVHMTECVGCRREYALDQLLAQEKIATAPGFSAGVMRSIAANNRRFGIAAIAASLLLMISAGWFLASAPAAGVGGTLVSLFADALTVGWGWLGASWVGLRTAVRPNLSPQTVIGLALMMTAFSILTWRVVRRRPATSKHRSR